MLCPVPGVRARPAGCGALPRQAGLHPDLAAGRAESERDPVEGRIPLDLRALCREYPAALAQPLCGHVVQRRGGADEDLCDRIEETRALVVGGEPLLPDLGLGALLEDDQRAEADRGAVRVVDRRNLGRMLQALARGNVDERTSPPGSVVAGDERIVWRGHRAELLGDELGV